MAGLAPPELVNVVQREQIEQYIENGSAVIISDDDLKTHRVNFVKHPQNGFVGTCTYQLRGPDEETTADASLPVRRQSPVVVTVCVLLWTWV